MTANFDGQTFLDGEARTANTGLASWLFLFLGKCVLPTKFVVV